MLHASGRYDRPVSTRRRVASEQRRYHSLIVRTEQSVSVVFRTLAWAVLRLPGRFAKGDVTIEHRRKRWVRLDGYALLLSKIRYLGGKKKCWAVIGVYQGRTSKTRRVLIGVHMPARVEGPLRRGENTVDTRAWEESLLRLGIEVDRLREEYPDARLDVVGDWNVDVSDAFFRNMITAALGIRPALAVDAIGQRLAWSDVPGTHNHRVIDWDWSTDKDATCTVRSRNAASDHRPVAVD